MNEIDYEQSDRTAWLQMLKFCMENLGYDSPEANEARWVLEREAAIAQLRIVCEDFGDNEWDSDEYLPDVIEKHLARHLEQPNKNKSQEYLLEGKPLTPESALNYARKYGEVRIDGDSYWLIINGIVVDELFNIDCINKHREHVSFRYHGEHGMLYIYPWKNMDMIIAALQEN